MSGVTTGGEIGGPFLSPMLRYHRAKDLRKDAEEIGDMRTAFLSAIDMYLAELEIIALGGSLEQAGVPYMLKDTVTDKMQEARDELTKHGLWPL